MKKLFIALGTALPSVLAFAEETSGTQSEAFAGSVAEDIANAASGTLTNFLEGVGPILGGIVVSGLVIWGGMKLVPLVKQAFSAGKGR